MTVAIRTDEAIQKDIVDALYWDDRVDSSNIGVTVDDGMVTLTGEVPTYTAKLVAAENAQLIGGVRSVDNEIEVTLLPEILTDSEITSNIADALVRDVDLFAYDIDVDVAAGWVTLEGTVNTYWKRAKAEDLAANVRGVVGVTNKIAVVPTQDYVDERLAERIVDAVDRDLGVDINDVNVVVEDGQVTLTGTVPTWMAKNAAYSAARYTLGVRDVKNRIAVSPASV